MSGEADLKIVIIMLIFVGCYGLWNFLFMSEQLDKYEIDYPLQNYTTPESGEFFGTIKQVFAFHVDNPELVFVNYVIFFPLSLISVFIFLRYLRG